MNAIDIKNTAENEDMRLKTAAFSFKKKKWGIINTFKISYVCSTHS